MKICSGPELAPAQRRKGVLARLARDKRGTTAIEFAALVLPFCMLVFAIIESCVSFAAQEVLANATDDLARQFRTGEIQASPDLTPEKVRTMICGRIQI